MLVLQLMLSVHFDLKLDLSDQGPSTRNSFPHSEVNEGAPIFFANSAQRVNEGASNSFASSVHNVINEGYSVYSASCSLAPSSETLFPNLQVKTVIFKKSCSSNSGLIFKSYEHALIRKGMISSEVAEVFLITMKQ